MYDEITDAAEDCTTNLAEPACAHHDVAGLLARSHLDDELARLLEVRYEFTANLPFDKTQTEQTHRQLQNRHSDTPVNQHRISHLYYIICCNINHMSELH